MLEKLLSELRGDFLGQLRFFVLREFGILPSSREGRRLSDYDCILYALRLLLEFEDEGEFNNADFNSSFDTEKYLSLREGDYGKAGD